MTTRIIATFINENIKPTMPKARGFLEQPSTEQIRPISTITNFIMLEGVKASFGITANLAKSKKPKSFQIRKKSNNANTKPIMP